MMGWPALTFAIPITVVCFFVAFFQDVPAWMRHAVWGVASANVLIAGLYDDFGYPSLAWGSIFLNLMAVFLMMYAILYKLMTGGLDDEPDA